MKGIILAGGTGSRLFPVTMAVSKQLLPVYNKPMIYYPLATLMQAGIKEVLVITSQSEQGLFRKLLRDGSQWGIKIDFDVQERPEGIAQALLIGESYLNREPFALILGDNLFFGEKLPQQLTTAGKQATGATVFVHEVANPSAYGVAEFNARGEVIKLTEKPSQPQSHFAVTGLYFYDSNACDMARSLRPSARGELEITDLNNLYLQEGRLQVEKLGRGTAWLDTGSPSDLLEASLFVRAIESRQGLMVCCPEEIAFLNGWIGKSQLEVLASGLGKTAYSQYLDSLVKRGLG